MYCYNCGKSVSNESTINESEDVDVVLKNHPEHVPAKCFYVDATLDQKRNLITVPACFRCNNKFSSIDDELRNILGITNNSKDKGEKLTNKSVQALLRKNNWQNQVVINRTGQFAAVKFNRDNVYLIYEKNFRALIYHQLGLLLNSDYKILILYDGFQFNIDGSYSRDEQKTFEKKVLMLSRMLMDNGSWKSSGDKEIFEFIILPLSYNEQNVIIPESDATKAVSFIMMQVYHQIVEVVILAYNLSAISKGITS